MNRTQKAQEVESIRDRFDRMINAVITDYRGLDVESMTDLRKQFREANIEFKVVKNTLVKRATQDLPFGEELAGHLTDMTAIAWSYEDPSASAKVIRDFTKKNEKLKVKCGVMDGKVDTAKGWADMPNREGLLSMITAQLINGPQSLMQQMMGPGQDVVSLLDAWKEKLEQEGATE